MSKKIESANRTRSINVYLPVDEFEQFNEVCGYFNISSTRLISVINAYLYHKFILGEFEVDLDEIAAAYNIGYGVLADIFNVYE